MDYYITSSEQPRRFYIMKIERFYSMKIENSETIDVNMSALTGYVNTTYDHLVRTFGPPTFEFDDLDDKVQTEWVLKIDGVVATIYNWKTGGTPMGQYQWHIGGYDKGEVDLVKKALAI